MNSNRLLSCGGHGGCTATARKPRAVVVGNSVFTANVTDRLRALGWDVVNIAAGDDLARAILARKPSAVILPAETGEESGPLVAAKLRKVKPKMKVAIVDQNRSATAERFAKFVGASYVIESDGAARAVSSIVH